MVRQEPGKESSGYGWAVRIGTELAAAIFIGVAIGHSLDQWLQTTPWLTLMFFLFGVAAGFLNLYRTVTSDEAGPDQAEPP